MTLELKQLIFVVKSALKDIPLDEKKRKLSFKINYTSGCVIKCLLSLATICLTSAILTCFFFVMGVNGLPFLPHILFVF